MEAIKNKHEPSALPDKHPARQLLNVWQSLSLSEEGLIVVDGSKIFIPSTYRPKLLQELHAGHGGIQKTVQTARSLYFWPDMKNQIKQMVDKCEPCQRVRPSLPIEPLIESTAEYPMQHVGSDLFHHAGRDYLLVVDRYSGYPLVAKLSGLSTASIVPHLDRWFTTFGLPTSARTDGGPCYRSAEFRRFCEDRGIRHEMSSPHHHESNGFSETNVKNIKHLMMKTGAADFEKALAAWRNTARAERPSPSEMFFRRRLRTCLPITDVALRQTGHIRKGRTAGVQGQPLTPLQVGDTVWVQHHDTKRWTIKAVVTNVSHTGRTYNLITEAGVAMIRNRRYIRNRVT